MLELGIASPLGAGLHAVTPLGHFGRAILRCSDAEIDLVSLRIGIDLPRTVCRSATVGSLSALCIGPDEWLLLQATAGIDWVADLSTDLEEICCSLVDISHRQVALAVTGPRTHDILATGCALDLALEAFPIGMCTRTRFSKAEVVLWRTAEDRFHLEVWRSFARYVEALLYQAEDEA